MLKHGAFFSGTILYMVLIACGGERDPTGTVSLALESSGTTAADIARVEIKVTGVDVHISGQDDTNDSDAEKGGAWLSTRTQPGTIDLLRLKNDVHAALGEVNVYGPITQIRLRIDPMGANRVVRTDGTSCPIDTSAIDPTGVRIIHPFAIIEPVEQGLTSVVLDMDLAASLRELGPCNYKLTPVLRVAVVER
jgi:hypothetical protein